TAPTTKPPSPSPPDRQPAPTLNYAALPLTRCRRPSRLSPFGAAVIVDESFGTTGQSYQLTRIHHLGEHTVRIEICYDTYVQQSHATAAVLGAGQTWTILLAEPSSNWHDAMPSPYSRPAPTARALYPLAEGLAERAAVVL